MNGNTPYAGLPGSTQAGKRASADVPELTAEQKRRLRADVSRIAALTREFLPDEYVVDGDISNGVGGPQATVAVNPPAGHPVSAGFTPDPEDLDAGLEKTETDEVAKGLAASAALQVMNAIGDLTPTAK